jgi:hypothetical protein
MCITGLAYGSKSEHSGDLVAQDYETQLLDLCATASLSVGIALLLAQMLGAVVFWKVRSGDSEWLPAVSFFIVLFCIVLFYLFILYYIVLFCFVLFCSVLFCFIHK